MLDDGKMVSQSKQLYLKRYFSKKYVTRVIYSCITIEQIDNCTKWICRIYRDNDELRNFFVNKITERKSNIYFFLGSITFVVAL